MSYEETYFLVLLAATRPKHEELYEELYNFIHSHLHYNREHFENARKRYDRILQREDSERVLKRLSLLGDEFDSARLSSHYHFNRGTINENERARRIIMAGQYVYLSVHDEIGEKGDLFQPKTRKGFVESLWTLFEKEKN